MLMQIKYLRKSRGMTQSQFAERMGVMQNTVSQWEHEVSLPHIRQLPLMAQVLGCTISDLFLSENIKDFDLISDTI